MNSLNPSELELARALAVLTPANPTPAQRELAQQILLAFNQKTLALDTVSREYVSLKSQLRNLQLSVGQALTTSLRQPVSTSGQKPATLVPTKPRLVTEVDHG